MSHRITWEEYKELMAKYNLEPNSYNAAFMPNGEPKQHSIPFFQKYGKHQGHRCAVFSEYFGVKIRRDMEYWYTWLITKEEVEVALNEMFKFLKDEQIKERMNSVRSDFV
ncbi:MAG: hypothetical protein J6V44_14110 [Methanobrevibacter sp.]|nr:hypothetical protein [Methanobrevibacter sp.]